MTGAIAVLGPGGVGGLVAGALARSGVPVTVVAREETAALIMAGGLRVDSVRLGTFVARPRAVSHLAEPADALVVATKATSLERALERVEGAPALVLPLLNGLEHLAVLRARFGAATVVAGTIRVESDRPEPGVIVHTSPFLRVEMASGDPRPPTAMKSLAATLERAGVPARVLDSEAEVMWSKLVRLVALACATSAFDMSIGPILSTPELRAELVAAVEEAAAVARAEGADIDPAATLAELTEAHPALGSSMRRDIAAGRAVELDAIAGAVLRTGARHGLACPSIERLVELIVRRVGVRAPAAGA